MNSYDIYKKLPYQLQNMLCSVYGSKCYNQRYKGYYDQLYASLLESDHWSAEQIKAYKEEQLFKIIEYAYKNCPFYTKLYQEHGVSPSTFSGLDSLELFPIITKDQVRENWKQMLSPNISSSQIVDAHTSGSSGKSLDFKVSKHNLQLYWASVWRGRARVGIQRDEDHLNLTGKIVVPIETSKAPYWRYNAPMHQYMLNMHHISADKIGDIAKFIDTQKFSFFVGYASIMNSIAVLLDECNIEIKNPPKYIFSSGEKMYDNQRQIIEKVFAGTQIVEHYGFSENEGAASKCEKGFYHEDFEIGHFELVNSSPSDRGTTGELLATGFHNFAMPFIRYSIGDTVTFANHECSCGRHSQVIVEIEGRNGDYILTPEGAKVARTGYLFKETHDIKECQIIQRKQGEITLKIIKRDNYRTETEDQLKALIAKWISPTIGVKFEYVSEIPRTSAGKFKQVISEIDK